MTCDVTRNRLLALPDLARPTDDLRAHIATCGPCTAWLERARQLDKAIADLPVPDTSDARAAFVDYLTVAGPVIKSIPKIDRSGGFTWVRKLDWRVASGLAASVAVGLGIWAYSGPGKSTNEVAGPKHELLARGVDFVTAMSKARTPQERTRVSMTMAGNLRDEVKDLYNSASPDDLDKLAELYEKVVTRGLVPQAKELGGMRVPVQERADLRKQVRDHLAAVAQDAATLKTTARAQAVPSLDRIQKAALSGRGDLDALLGIPNPAGGE